MNTMVTTHDAMNSGFRPSLDELLERARAMREHLLAESPRTDAGRRVSAEIMQQLDDEGLTRISRSNRFGGYGYGPSALARLGYELGQGCGSAAWCACLTNCNSWYATYWPAQAQDEIWRENPDARLVAVVAPTGKCEIVEDGFKVWGQWPWASNCENSQWATVAAIVPELNGRPTRTAWFLVPTDALTIDQNSWFVIGMQGTGSKTLVAENPIFVPKHRMIYFDDIAAGTVPGCSIPENHLGKVCKSPGIDVRVDYPGR